MIDWNQEYLDIPLEDWLVLKRVVRYQDRYICVLCNRHAAWDGKTQAGVVDHILPLADDGRSVLENLRLLCYTCHREVTRLWRSDYEKRRWARRRLNSGVDPRVAPQWWYERHGNTDITVAPP